MKTSIDPETLFQELFAPKGLLASSLPGYEHRKEQEEMAKKIWQSFSGDRVALFEAGTGIGKSLAYLIPALLWSHHTGEKIVVSTYTIALQEQLLEKDIPTLLSALGIDLRVVLAKGMGNYLCLRKHESHDNPLSSWASKTRDGTRSSLTLPITNHEWKELNAESESCTRTKCPHYQDCFFFKARARLHQADVIIVNHHLLMAHLQSDEGQELLPPFTRLILDEAHHLPTVTRSATTQVVDRVELFRLLARIHSDTHPETSLLLNLRDKLQDKSPKSLINRLGLDLPAERRKVTDAIHDAFDEIDFMLNESRDKRITDQELESNLWKNEIFPRFQKVREQLLQFTASLDSLDIPQEEETLFDIKATTRKLEEKAAIIDAYFHPTTDVRYIQKRGGMTTLCLAPLDVAPFLEKKLFESVDTAILCSATLAVDNTFDHLISQIGLEGTTPTQTIYPSPFDYLNRVQLFGATDLPPPTGYTFIDEACSFLLDAIKVSRGGAFILFTSLDMLNKCSAKLKSPLTKLGYPLLCQGDRERTLLLKEFRKVGNAVLLGADSFWEGVDVVGDALRLVAIAKLPFPVPSDPVVQARSEAIQQSGGDPFFADSVPHAVKKFKQGFGRLMRATTDRGTILCLDQRLFTRGYGKIFLNSLPECPVSFTNKQGVLEALGKFYNAH